MSATTTPRPVEYVWAELDRISIIDGSYLYQSAAAAAGVLSIATAAKRGCAMSLFCSIHCTPSSCSVVVSSGREGSFRRYVSAPGNESSTVPPSVEAMREMFAMGETFTMTGILPAACALTAKNKMKNKQNRRPVNINLTPKGVFVKPSN